MMSFTLSTKSALLAVLSSAALAAAAFPALAMPADGGLRAAVSGSSLQTAADQHRVYPGSESASAQKAREDRNAPNRFCEKQQQYCE